MYWKLSVIAFILTVDIHCSTITTSNPRNAIHVSKKSKSHLARILSFNWMRKRTRRPENAGEQHTTPQTVQCCSNDHTSVEHHVDNYDTIKKTVQFVEGSEMREVPKWARKSLKQAEKSKTREDFIEQMGNILRKKNRRKSDSRFFIIEVAPQAARPRSYVIDGLTSSY